MTCEHDWASYMAQHDFGRDWLISFEKCLKCDARRRRKLNVVTMEPMK